MVLVPPRTIRVNLRMSVHFTEFVNNSSIIHVYAQYEHTSNKQLKERRELKNELIESG